MSFTNTKGGWKYRKDVSGKSFYIETVDMAHTKTFIGEVGGGLHTESEIEANARLISSAPQLMFQMQRLSDWNKKYPSSKIFSQGEIIKIAKELDEIVEDGQALIRFVNGE